MSSKLKGKKKKMQPEGYSAKTLREMRDVAKRKHNTEALVDDATYSIQLIAFQILHDKFGFGHKRLERIEQFLNKFGNTADMEAARQTLDYLEEYGIYTKEEANKIPSREIFALTRYKIDAKSWEAGRYYLLATTYTYFSMLGYCLKTEFRFSVRQIKETYGWIRYYINTLSRQKQFDLTIEGIADTMAEECKYYDSRFIERFQQKGLI